MMPEQSRMHFYLNWAKERIDEMDATLASLEAKAGQVQADSKAKASQLVADLQKRREEFQAALKKQAEAGEAACERAKPQLEARWNEFEGQVKTYIDTVGKQVQQQHATFQDVAAAQRANIDAALKQMKADSSEAEARFQKLKQAGSESWTVLGAALAESRKAFDRANQAAWQALKHAAPKP